jgi:hypothetical protein
LKPRGTAIGPMSAALLFVLCLFCLSGLYLSSKSSTGVNRSSKFERTSRVKAFFEFAPLLWFHYLCTSPCTMLVLPCSRQTFRFLTSSPVKFEDALAAVPAYQRSQAVVNALTSR